jgi:nitrate reductase NapE component
MIQEAIEAYVQKTAKIISITLFLIIAVSVIGGYLIAKFS